MRKQTQRTPWTRQQQSTLPTVNNDTNNNTNTNNNTSTNSNAPLFSPKMAKRAGLFFFCCTISAVVVGLFWFLDPGGIQRQKEIERNFTSGVVKERLRPVRLLAKTDDNPEINLRYWGNELFPEVCAYDEVTIETCRAMKKFTKNGELLVSISNSGNADMWENWAKSAIKAGVTNFVTFTMEKKAFVVEDQELAEHLVSLPTYLAQKVESGASEGNQSSFHDFRTSVYVVFMKSVPDLVLWVLKQKISIFYSDTDVVFLSNPFDAVHNEIEKIYSNWLLQADGGFSSRTNLNSCKITAACGGVFYAHYSSFSLRVAEEWVSAVLLGKLKSTGNQKAYNLVISGIGKPAFGTLPCDQFPNGYRYNEAHLGTLWRPEQKRPPVLVHNNWVIGKANKIVAFKRWNMWLEDLEEGAEIIPRLEEDPEKVQDLKKTTKMAMRKNRDEVSPPKKPANIKKKDMVAAKKEKRKRERWHDEKG